MAPQTIKAIKVIEGGKGEVQEVPLPKLRDDYVLVKVKAVALNPTDWKHMTITALGHPGSTLGCDFSGVVEEIGPKVTKQWKVGDRIASVCHGANSLEPEDGSFGEYAIAKGDLGLKIPDNLTDEEAATLGVGVSTVGQGVYQSLGLPLPGEGKFDGYLLVYGGSTATGTLAIQYAKLVGAKVISTSSKHNFGLLEKLGAEKVFDYKDPDCAKKIREYTNDSLTHVFDTFSEGASPTICEEAISSKGGAISYLLPAKHSRKDVENKHTLAYSIMGEPMNFAGQDIPAKPEDLAFAAKFWALSEKLIGEGKIVVHPTQVQKGGLSEVFDGLKQLQDGKVSGVKLVYRINQ